MVSITIYFNLPVEIGQFIFNLLLKELCQHANPICGGVAHITICKLFCLVQHIWPKTGLPQTLLESSVVYILGEVA